MRDFYCDISDAQLGDVCANCSIKQRVTTVCTSAAQPKTDVRVQRSHRQGDRHNFAE